VTALVSRIAGACLVLLALGATGFAIGRASTGQGPART
jgi:hypothetical protein